MSDDRYVDRGQLHRRQVLARIEALWEAHPQLAFCDLIYYIIYIGDMVWHTTDEEVIQNAILYTSTIKENRWRR